MNFIGVFYSLGAAVTWGLVYTFDQRILNDVSPLNLLFIDAVLTIVVLLPIFAFHQESLHQLSSITKTDSIYIVASLVLGIAANFLIYSGIQSLGAETASMLEIAYPLFVALFCFVLFRQAITPWAALGGVLMVVGAMVIIRLG